MTFFRSDDLVLQQNKIAWKGKEHLPKWSREDPRKNQSERNAWRNFVVPKSVSFYQTILSIIIIFLLI